MRQEMTIVNRMSIQAGKTIRLISSEIRLVVTAPGVPPRSWWSLVLAGCVVLALAGCGAEQVRTADGAGPIRLTYWSAPNPQEQELANQLVAKWNEENPDVQVTVQPLPAGQSSEEVLLAAVVAGTTPDLCSNIWPGILSDFIRAKGVLPLDTLPGFDALMQERVPADVLESFRSPDGHFYQIPWKTNPIMMLYNEQLFREAGVERPPRTYGEYLDAAAKLTADLDGDGQYDRWIGYRDVRPIWWQRYFDYFSFYIGASGGRTFARDGVIRIDTAASNDVFAFFQELYTKRYFPLTTFQGNPFVAEKIATEFTGPWNVAWMEAYAPPGMEFSYSPLPVPDDHEGPVYTYGDFKNIAIFSSTKHPEAAWRFAQYLVSEEADLKLLEVARQIPVRKDLLDDPAFAAFFAANPKMLPFAEQAPYTRSVDDIPSFQEVLDAVAQQFEAATYGAVRPAVATERALERIQVISEWSR